MLCGGVVSGPKKKQDTGKKGAKTEPWEKPNYVRWLTDGWGENPWSTMGEAVEESQDLFSGE